MGCQMCSTTWHDFYLSFKYSNNNNYYQTPGSVAMAAKLETRLNYVRDFINALIFIFIESMAVLCEKGR